MTVQARANRSCVNARPQEAADATSFLWELFAPVADVEGTVFELRTFADSEARGLRPTSDFFRSINDLGRHVEDFMDRFAVDPKSQGGRGRFYGLQTRVRCRGRDEDVELAVAIGLDFDGGIELARANLARVPWPASAVIMTGHGLHMKRKF